ncbi:hypothetical protein CF328_g4755 [Tilletia controversa]|nr:hypothetical protein CF328_g4755 [Tilletia controversa]
MGATSCRLPPSLGFLPRKHVPSVLPFVKPTVSKPNVSTQNNPDAKTTNAHSSRVLNKVNPQHSLYTDLDLHSASSVGKGTTKDGRDPFSPGWVWDRERSARTAWYSYQGGVALSRDETRIRTAS